MSADEQRPGTPGGSQPATTAFNWNATKEQAAVLFAENELTVAEIAEKVGADRTQLWRWRQYPEFAARVAEVARTLGDRAERYAIARRDRRLKAMDDRWRKLQQIAEERGADPDMKDVPGGTTGYLVHQVKAVGRGEDFQLIDEYILDTGLLKELREHEHQAAVELGQWVSKIAPTNPDGTDEYTATGFTADEITGILEGLAARLGIAVDGPAGAEREDPPRLPAP